MMASKTKKTSKMKKVDLHINVQKQEVTLNLWILLVECVTLNKKETLLINRLQTKIKDNKKKICYSKNRLRKKCKSKNRYKNKRS